MKAVYQGFKTTRGKFEIITVVYIIKINRRQKTRYVRREI